MPLDAWSTLVFQFCKNWSLSFCLNATVNHFLLKLVCRLQIPPKPFVFMRFIILSSHKDLHFPFL